MSAATTSAVERFQHDGFLVMPEFIDAATVADLRDAYDDILEGRTPARGDGMLGGITRQVMLPSTSDARFRSNAALTAAGTIAEQLLEGPVEFYFDMLIDKPPGHPHETPWHQDMSYALQPFALAGTPITLTNVQFWVALDDTDAENGCMHFLPAVHHGALLEHHVASGDPLDTQRLLAITNPARDLDLASAVVAALPAGGATVHSYGTPHYTPSNRSTDRRRRAYIFNFRRLSAAA